MQGRRWRCRPPKHNNGNISHSLPLLRSVREQKPAGGDGRAGGPIARLADATRPDTAPKWVGLSPSHSDRIRPVCVSWPRRKQEKANSGWNLPPDAVDVDTGSPCAPLWAVRTDTRRSAAAPSRDGLCLNLTGLDVYWDA